MKRLFLLLLSFSLIVNPVWASGNDSNTVSLLHLNGTDGSQTITDDAAGGTHTWTARGNFQIDTAQSVFGGASGLADGTGDWTDTPDSADFAFGTGNFTVDFRYRVSSAPAGNQQIIGQYADDDHNWYIRVDNDLIIVHFQDGVGVTKGRFYGSFTPSTNTWYHIAVVRNGSTPYIFVDGSSLSLTEATPIGTNDVGDVASVLYLGTREGTQWFFNGWPDEVRVSKGIARWTANFTPPAAEYDTSADAAAPTMRVIFIQ